MLFILYILIDSIDKDDLRRYNLICYDVSKAVFSIVMTLGLRVNIVC